VKISNALVCPEIRKVTDLQKFLMPQRIEKAQIAFALAAYRIVLVIVSAGTEE
jgi:hypothetical protein